MATRRQVQKILASSGEAESLGDALGYTFTTLEADECYRLYHTNPVAGAVVDKHSYSVWAELPSVVEDSEINERDVTATELTAFEQQIYELLTANDALNICLLADIMARIEGKAYIKYDASAEDGAKFTAVQGRIVTKNADGSYTIAVEGGSPIKAAAEDMLLVTSGIFPDGDTYISIYQRIYNQLVDLTKVVGGAAEMFWLGGYQGVVFNVADDAVMTEESKQAMQTQIDDYLNRLHRAIRTKGVNVETLSSSIGDPTASYTAILKLISAATNIPERILFGSENGQNAGEQDLKNFSTYISSLQVQSEYILRWIIEKLLPGNRYYFKWQSYYKESDTDKIAIAKARIEALKLAAPNGDITEICTVDEIRAMLGMPPMEKSV